MKLTITAKANCSEFYSRSRLERLRLKSLFTLICAFTLGLDGASFASLGFLAPSQAIAAQGADERLPKLEVKFFKHTFPKDDDNTRLDRLEKMIFGEVKGGNTAERIKNLADTVPNLSSIKVGDDGTEVLSEDASSAGSGSSSSSSSSSSSASGRSSAAGSGKRAYEEDVDGGSAAGRGGQVLQGESKYPAVTALEMSIFKRDYAGEPVGDRLNRLESKVFGKPSKFTDLSERVDALKDKLNVDLAKSRPAGSDWIDEEDDDMPQQAQSPRRNSEPVARSDGDDGRSFSGRDLRKDMQRAFGNSAGGNYGGSSSSIGGGASGAYGGASSGIGGGAAASGAYGMGGAAASGAYGMGGSRRRSAAAQGDDDLSTAAPPGSGVLGLSSQVSALETAVLGQNYKDPLINRVARLEDAVFQGKAPANAGLSLPERVAKLTQKVPIAAAPPKTASTKRSRRDADDDFGDDDDMGMSMGSMAGGGMSQTTQSRGSGGLGKIINSIGNMLGGGMYAGSYGISGGGMVRDPNTGYLVDTMTGNLINPSTGMVVGRSGYSTGYGMGGFGGMAVPPNGSYGINGLNTPTTGAYGYNGLPYGMGGFGYAPTYNTNSINPMNPLGGFNSFNNGFSPYGYGYPGVGRTGINFGTGGFGIRF